MKKAAFVTTIAFAIAVGALLGQWSWATPGQWSW